MKHLPIALITTALLAFSSFSFAEGKIAVFNLQGAILATDAAQKQIKEFESKAAYSRPESQLRPDSLRAAEA